MCLDIWDGAVEEPTSGASCQTVVNTEQPRDTHEITLEPVFVGKCGHRDDVGD